MFKLYGRVLICLKLLVRKREVKIVRNWKVHTRILDQIWTYQFTNPCPVVQYNIQQRDTNFVQPLANAPVVYVGD
jgi:hypothetical protein